MLFVAADMLRVVTLVCPPSTVSLASFGALLAQLPLASLQPSASSLRAAQGTRHPELHLQLTHTPPTSGITKSFVRTCPLM